MTIEIVSVPIGNGGSFGKCRVSAEFFCGHLWFTIIVEIPCPNTQFHPSPPAPLNLSLGFIAIYSHPITSPSKLQVLTIQYSKIAIWPAILSHELPFTSKSPFLAIVNLEKNIKYH